MFKKLCKWWFLRQGWTTENCLPKKENGDELNKYVLIAAPHTSNWDFIFGMGAKEILQLPIRFTIKKEWMKFPFGGFMRSLGALPIDRTPKAGNKPRVSMVDLMADLLVDAKQDLFMVVTPEATRSRREQWKGGYYHIAKQAGVPIALAYLDYKTKRCGIGEVIYLTDDANADMRRIMAFYQSKTGHYPDKFSVDKRYL
ncbi:MAG: 1-acyl-sn-glycerol-3-phosphate acyltransferase [Thiolinea sp.]